MTNLPPASEIRKTARLAEQRLHDEAAQAEEKLKEQREQRAAAGKLFAQSKLSQISDAIRSSAINGNYCYQWTEVAADDTLLSQLFLESFAKEISASLEPLGYTVSYSIKTLRVRNCTHNPYENVYHPYYAVEMFILW